MSTSSPDNRNHFRDEMLETMRVLFNHEKTLACFGNNLPGMLETLGLTGCSREDFCRALEIQSDSLEMYLASLNRQKAGDGT